MLGVISSKQLGLVILSGLAYNEAPSQSMGWFLHWQVLCRGFFLGGGMATAICSIKEMAIRRASRLLHSQESGDVSISSSSPSNGVQA